MTVQGHHAVCDGCGTAMTPAGSTEFEAWERISGWGHPDAHLCSGCQERRDRGWLADPHAAECARCGRNSVDHPDVAPWWQMPGDAPGIALVSVCDPCKRRAEAAPA